MKVLFPRMFATKWPTRGGADRGQLLPGVPSPLLALLLVFWTAVSGVFCLVGLSFVPKQLATLRWPSAPATILSSEARGIDTPNGAALRPEIRYRYEVNGATHESSRATFSEWSTNDVGEVRRLVRAHPVGGSTMIRYDPMNPAEAVLMPGLSREHWTTVSVMSFFASVPLIGWPLMLIGWFVARRKDRRASYFVSSDAAGAIARPIGFEAASGAVFGVLVFGGMTGVMIMATAGAGGARSFVFMWSVAACASAVLGMAAWRLSRRRGRWIVIDRREGVLRAPAVGWGGVARVVPLDRIRGVWFQGQGAPGTEKKYGTLSVSWLPGVRVVYEGDRGETNAPVMCSVNERNNLLIADWLSNELDAPLLDDPRGEAPSS